MTTTRWWEFLEAAMQAKGLTAVELASRAEFNSSTVSHWKKGDDRTPRVELVRRIADVLEVNFLDAMLAAGIIRPTDLDQQSNYVDLSEVPDDAIIEEALRRTVRIREESSKLSR